MEFLIQNISINIDLITIIHGSIMGGVFLFEGKKESSKYLLGFFLMLFVLELVSSILLDFDAVKEDSCLEYLPFNFYFLTQPVLFLYAKSITSTLKQREDWRHLIPGLVEFIALTITFIWICLKLRTDTSIVFELTFLIYVFSAIIFMFYYGIKTLFYIRRYRKGIIHLYSNLNGKQLKWLYHIAILNVIVGIVSILLFIPVISGWLNYNNISILVSMLDLFFIYWITIGGLKQVQLESSKQNDSKIEINTPKKEPIFLDDEDSKVLVDFMEIRKPYRDPDLSLHKLSNLCNIPQRTLSQIINRKFKLNFNQFVNKYRIEEAKRMLKDDAFANFGVEGIGIEAGFNSKTTYYSTFKNFCGVSPNQYRID